MTRKEPCKRNHTSFQGDWTCPSCRHQLCEVSTPVEERIPYCPLTHPEDILWCSNYDGCETQYIAKTIEGFQIHEKTMKIIEEQFSIERVLKRGL